MIQKLQEKASIDWNNYLTKQEVEKFLSKDDKVESAEEIVYNRKGDFYNKYFKHFKEQGWTKRDLTQDLAQFFYNGHLITENKDNFVQQINNIVDKCIKAGLKNKLKEYTIPYMRDYQLKFNPTADNRKTPWIYITQEIKANEENISWELQEFIDAFIKAANDCYKENSKLKESKYILRGTQDGKTFDIAYSDNEQKLQNFKDEITKGNPNVSMWVDGNNNKITEGIHLYGFIKDEEGNSSVIEDSDYPTKLAYEKDLKANGYKVRRINDNRDMYIMDHSDYLSVADVKGKIKKLQQDIEYCKENNLLSLVKYNEKELEQLQELLDKANKISLTESYKLEEASRNELLAKTKMQTKTRYDKADGYKGFGLKNVNIDKLLKDGTLPVTCKVGKYNDIVELENVPYWIQLQAKRNNNNQLSNHVVRDAILQAVDAMDIKVDCDCGDFKYRMAWGATEGGYKYGQPENRPANITNPNKYGALCKHLTAMLSNKKWMQKVAAPVLDYIEQHLDEFNKFLNVKQGEELTMPNELARGMAKKAAQGRKQDREERLKEVAKEFIQQRKNFIIRNANDEDEILEGIKAYINYKYKDATSGVDYLKANTMEQEYILDIVNKWLIDHNYKKDYNEEFEQQNNNTEQNNKEGEANNEETEQ